MSKNTKSINPKVLRIKKGRKILLSKCAMCNSKKFKFLKEQEARGFLSNFKGIKINILSEYQYFTKYLKKIKLKQQ